MTAKFNKLPVILLSILWLISSGIMIAAKILARTSLGGLGQIAGVLFIVGLIVYYLRSAPKAADLPELEPMIWPKLNYTASLLLIMGVLVVIFIMGIAVHPWLVLVVALTLIAVWVIITHREHLTP